MESIPPNHGNIMLTTHDDPDDTLEKARQAVDTCPQDGLERLESLIQLGNLLWKRFKDTSECNYSLLDECIGVWREICELCPVGLANHASLYGNLGVCLHTRFEQLGDQSLLDEAISLKREALCLTPTGHPDRAHSCKSLATSLHTRFDQLGDQSLLDEAISLEREALCCSAGTPPRAGQATRGLRRD
jgi:hypothetical protein